jgi:hypothetical protein
MRIESKPNWRGAAKYCMYLSTGADCLCNTDTYEFDLTKRQYIQLPGSVLTAHAWIDGDWTGQKPLPVGHWESARFLRVSGLSDRSGFAAKLTWSRKAVKAHILRSDQERS